MALGDGLDNPTFAGLVGQFTRRPMADGTARRLRGLTRQGDDLAPLLGTEGGRRPWPRRVLYAFGDDAALACAPVATPASDRGACRAEAACHVGCRETLSQQENNLCPETQMLGRLVGTDHRVECVALLLREGHARRLGARHSR